MIDVLIVEDDLMVQEINKNCVLSIKEFNIVKICDDEKIIFDTLINHKIDLILLDLTLPSIDGIELLRRIKSEFNKTDVIIVSARNDNLSLQKALNLGVIDYILKPFKIQRLHISLNQYKLRKELLNQDINQEKIDKVIFLNNTYDLPKGIDENTLELIKNAILDINGYFSTNKLSEITKISRISLRKYLKYLENTNFLASKLEYKAKGRPQIYYKIL
ncbi:response regulator [Campylobacter canadensis]|uniref:Transcriptional regulatory protein n=1 Tax=Campylobacter canadensis TaxID=449520 RepID=A0ABS7WQ58_9BACT|nr:response regulator [Campylobacter canadensis]MBZ7986897.1 response regulator [Campylobacter canadensis]MBZ7994219.1 response regulator [Campylobacter canadensis]MBZ7995789.1 response regulator [Campylobacter canadensis]MBZ7997934.1 response regulator [Campylobacter canadensis]MBZ7999551.1 response regulator [Campylobacter canadensis]